MFAGAGLPQLRALTGQEAQTYAERMFARLAREPER